MNITITGRHLDLTEAIKTFTTTEVESLDKFKIEITNVSVILSTQTKKGKEHSGVELVINLAGKNSVIIKQNDTDLYAAITQAVERAQKAMRRIHDREVDHQKVGLNAVKAEANSGVDIKAQELQSEDEIVPVELELYKPREVEDVLTELKSGDKTFEIFLDIDQKTRVLYKRNDGKFGLY